MADEPGLYHELILVDQTKLCQSQRKLDASYEEALARLLLEVVHGLREIAAQKFGVPVDLVEGARDDVLLCGVDRLGEGLHPVGQRGCLRRGAEGCLHHLVDDAAEEESVGAFEVFGGVAVEIFIGDAGSVIAAAVQGDVDGVAKGAHWARVLLVEL